MYICTSCRAGTNFKPFSLNRAFFLKLSIFSKLVPSFFEADFYYLGKIYLSIFLAPNFCASSHPPSWLKKNQDCMEDTFSIQNHSQILVVIMWILLKVFVNVTLGVKNRFNFKEYYRSYKLNDSCGLYLLIEQMHSH